MSLSVCKSFVNMYLIYLFVICILCILYIYILFLIEGIVSKWKNNGYLLDKECFKSKKGSNAH